MCLHKVLKIALFGFFDGGINSMIAALGFVVMEAGSDVVARCYTTEELAHAPRVSKIGLDDFSIRILGFDSLLRGFGTDN